MTWRGRTWCTCTIAGPQFHEFLLPAVCGLLSRRHSLDILFSSALGSVSLTWCHEVKACSLWPRPENRESTPTLVATVSKDVLGLSRIGINGCSLETPAVWSKDNPGDMQDVNAITHESAERFWTGGNSGTVKCWDVNATQNRGVIMALDSNASGWISAVELWPEAGVLVCSHSSGIGFLDMRAGKLIRQQYTNVAVGGICSLAGKSPMLFAGVGKDLTQYDTRLFRDGVDVKPKAVGQWSLRAPVSSVTCTQSAGGHLLVACGCEDGHVAAFDTA